MPSAVVAVVLAGFYVGWLAGAHHAPRLISEVGHIRVFAAMAAVNSAAACSLTLAATPFVWLPSRVAAGMATATLFVVAESWVTAGGGHVRDRLMQRYVLATQLAATVGTAGVAVAGTSARSAAGSGTVLVAAGVLHALAVVPVALATRSHPKIPDVHGMKLTELWREVPLAVAGVVAHGAAQSAVLAAGAVWAARSGLSVTATGLTLAAFVAAGLVGVPAAGLLRVRFDRRFVIAGLCAASAGAAAAVAAVPASAGPFAAAAAVTVLGAVSVPLYGQVVGHAGDYLPGEVRTAAIGRLMLVNGAGAVAGPVVATAAMAAGGPDGLFQTVAAVYAVVAVYALWRTVRHPGVPRVLVGLPLRLDPWMPPSLRRRGYPDEPGG